MDRPVTELLTKLGPAPAAALGIGVPAARFNKWRLRNRVPWRYWDAIVAYAVSKPIEGVTLDTIKAAHEQSVRQGAASTPDCEPVEREGRAA